MPFILIHRGLSVRVYTTDLSSEALYKVLDLGLSGSSPDSGPTADGQGADGTFNVKGLKIPGASRTDFGARISWG